MKIDCAHCWAVTDKPSGHVNRARARGVRLFCSIECFAIVRQKDKKPKVRKINPEPPLLEAEVREWRMLREFPDYEISNDGRLRRATAGSNSKAGAHIRVSMGSSRPSYPTCGLTYRGTGKRVSRNAHRLVAAEFLAAPAEGQTKVLHDDDNRLNCCATNLKWGNDKDNKADAKRNNRYPVGADHPSAKKPWTRPRGEAQSRAKLTEADVRAILLDARTHREIAAIFGVDEALIGRIRQGKVWKHITNPEYNRMLEDGRARDAA